MQASIKTAATTLSTHRVESISARLGDHPGDVAATAGKTRLLLPRNRTVRRQRSAKSRCDKSDFDWAVPYPVSEPISVDFPTPSDDLEQILLEIPIPSGVRVTRVEVVVIRESSPAFGTGIIGVARFLDPLVLEQTFDFAQPGTTRLTFDLHDLIVDGPLLSVVYAIQGPARGQAQFGVTVFFEKIRGDSRDAKCC